MVNLLERIEHYYDSAPRVTARAEEIGPFTLFVAQTGWPFYARPRLGERGPFTVSDLARVRDRQIALGAPETLEWVDETTPALLPVARKAGLAILEGPLMVLHWSLAPLPAELPSGITLRTLTADDPALAPAAAVASVSFEVGGVGSGPAGPAERDARAATIVATELDTLSERIGRGQTVTVIAEDSTGPVAVGSHQPVGDVTEIVGVATLPTRRRLGLGTHVTAALIADAARRNIDITFLSAGSDQVARIYARAGFSRVATACIAGPSADGG